MQSMRNNVIHRKNNTNPNHNPDPNRYRPYNARIQKFIFIHYMATTPQWVVLQNSIIIVCELSLRILIWVHMPTTRDLFFPELLNVSVFNEIPKLG